MKKTLSKNMDRRARNAALSTPSSIKRKIAKKAAKKGRNRPKIKLTPEAYAPVVERIKKEKEEKMANRLEKAAQKTGVSGNKTIIVRTESKRTEAPENKTDNRSAQKTKKAEPTITSCKICGSKIHKKNLDRHMRKKHKSLTLEQKKKMFKNMTSAERKSYFYEVLGPDKVLGDDLFDSGRVVSGGGVGVGRTRKR